MKFWKNTLLTVFAFMGVASTVLYNACQVDSCSDLKCVNGGSCANGFCNCPTGYEGSQCETRSADKFVGTYYGNTNCDSNPSVYDTASVILPTGSLTSLKIVLHSNSSDTLIGTINGTSLSVSDISYSNYSRHIEITLDVNKLNIFNQTVSTNTRGITVKSVCNFVGLKIK